MIIPASTMPPFQFVQQRVQTAPPPSSVSHHQPFVPFRYPPPPFFAQRLNVNGPEQPDGANLISESPDSGHVRKRKTSRKFIVPSCFTKKTHFLWGSHSCISRWSLLALIRYPNFKMVLVSSAMISRLTYSSNCSTRASMWTLRMRHGKAVEEDR